MTDYISREAALAFQDELAVLLCKDVVTGDVMSATKDADLVKYLLSIPAADVRPVVRGKWKNNHCSACGMMPMGEEIWECCDFTPPKFEWFMNFCPNCGADMREPLKGTDMGGGIRRDDAGNVIDWGITGPPGDVGKTEEE